MRVRWLPWILLAAGCATADSEVHVEIEPASVRLTPLDEQTFVARATGTLSDDVTWSVIGGDYPISSSGVFVAPDRVPPSTSNPLVVRATSRTDPSAYADATVLIELAPLGPRQGPTSGGTRVVLQGEDFAAGEMTVTFDGIPGLDLEVLSPLVLRVTTPPHPGVGPVDVEVRRGTASGRVYRESFAYAATRFVFSGLEEREPCEDEILSVDTGDLDGNGESDIVIFCSDEENPGFQKGYAYFYSDTQPDSAVLRDLEVGEFAAGTYQAIDYDQNGVDDLLRMEGFALNIVTIGPFGPIFSSASTAASCAGECPIAAAGDLTGDQVSDVVIVDVDAETMFIVDGTFEGISVPFAIPPGSGVPHVLDLDGDDDLDIFFSVEGTSFDGGVSIFRRIDDTTFAAREDLFIADEIRDAKSADFNGDGMLDFVFGTSGANGAGLTWLRATGPTTYELEEEIVGFGNSVDLVETGDLDGDGLDDVVSCSAATTHCAVHFATTGDAFADAIDLFEPGAPRFGLSLLAGSDGLRLVLANAEALALYERDGAGFGPLEPPVEGGRTFHADACGDLGFVLSATLSPDSATLLLVSGTSAAAGTTWPFPRHIVADVVTGDIDGLGTCDVVVVAGTNDEATFNRVASVFTPVPGGALPEIEDLLLPEGVPHEAALFDADADGDLDLAVSLNDNGTLRVHLALRDAGAFGPANLIYAPGQVGLVSLRTGDLDGDGRDEILAFDGIDLFDVLTIVDGAPITRISLPVGNVLDAAVADLDDDYVPDVLVLSEDSGLYEIRFFRGTGSFGFVPLPAQRFPGTPVAFSLADVDGDRLPDVVVSGAVHRGLGAGLFGERERIAGREPVESQVTVDLDGDGMAELLQPSTGTWRLLVNRSR